MMLSDIRDKLDITPGITQKESAIRYYAVELFTDLIEREKLFIYKDVKELGDVTKDQLLNGYGDWEAYSKDGNSLFWTDDITMRLFGRKGLQAKELDVLTGGRDLLLMQADVLKESCQLILKTLKQ